MTEKIIDPRLYEIKFEEKELSLFLVPTEKNKMTANYIKKKISKKFNVVPSINDLTCNLYFTITKNRVPKLIDFVEKTDSIKALEIDDFKENETELDKW